jgi:hypothetical protein
MISTFVPLQHVETFFISFTCVPRDTESTSEGELTLLDNARSILASMERPPAYLDVRYYFHFRTAMGPPFHTARFDLVNRHPQAVETEYSVLEVFLVEKMTPIIKTRRTDERQSRQYRLGVELEPRMRRWPGIKYEDASAASVQETH